MPEVCCIRGPAEVGRVDRAGVSEIRETARSLASRDAYCQNAIRRIEPTLRGSYAQQGLTFVIFPFDWRTAKMVLLEVRAMLYGSMLGERSA